MVAAAIVSPSWHVPRMQHAYWAARQQNKVLWSS